MWPHAHREKYVRGRGDSSEEIDILQLLLCSTPASRLTLHRFHVMLEVPAPCCRKFTSAFLAHERPLTHVRLHVTLEFAALLRLKSQPSSLHSKGRSHVCVRMCTLQ